MRSWADTNGDGIGDLNGVTARLDYLQSLGISGIWLMPINPSPSYHGYDITDYYGINPQYGTLDDFRHLLAEAHKRHIKVIIDLVINHSSDQHPWFKAARDVSSPYHDWYSWAGPHTDLDAISAVGGKAWRTAGNAHYLGDFTGAMPDLNYDTPGVRQEMLKLGRYWLRQGVDGFRLDAAQHIYYDFKAQDGDPVVLKKNLAWWSQFRHGHGCGASGRLYRGRGHPGFAGQARAVVQAAQRGVRFSLGHAAGRQRKKRTRREPRRAACAHRIRPAQGHRQPRAGMRRSCPTMTRIAS